MNRQTLDFSPIKPDVRVMLLQMISTAILSFYLQNQAASFLLFFIISLLVLCWNGIFSFTKNLLIYTGMNLLAWLFGVIGIPALSAVIPAFLMMLLRILPVYLSLRLLISRAPMNELFYTLEKLHVPRALSIPLMVVYRYVPTILLEFKYVKESLKMRGLNFSLQNLSHCMAAAENYVVPLLARSEKISEELSAAALCKGLSASRKRSCCTDVRLAPTDYICILTMLCIIGALLYLNHLNLSWRDFVI